MPDPLNKKLRRLRRFYWTHDRFRRSVNFVWRHWWALWICLVIYAGMGVYVHVTSANSLVRSEQYAQGYHEAMERASMLNDQLRTCTEEQRNLRQELSSCRSK